MRVLLYSPVQEDGRPRLLTFDRKNKTERDVVFDTAVPLGGGRADNSPCKGALLWTPGALTPPSPPAPARLLRWFGTNEACLQMLDKPRRGQNQFTVSRELHIECDTPLESLGKGEGDGDLATPWLQLGDSLLARAVLTSDQLSLELLEIEVPPGTAAAMAAAADMRSVRFKPQSHAFSPSSGGAARREERVRLSTETILRDCLGHAFVQALGYVRFLLSSQAPSTPTPLSPPFR